MKWSANKPCVCQSGRKAKGCCGPILKGALAPSPEALMRSRYAAYARGHIEHIMRTTHPQGPHHQTDRDQWAADIQRFCDGFQFEGLEVKDVHQNGVQAWVEFRARISQDGIDHSFGERSTFFQMDGAWLYHSGTPIDEPIPE